MPEVNALPSGSPVATDLVNFLRPQNGGTTLPLGYSDTTASFIDTLMLIEMASTGPGIPLSPDGTVRLTFDATSVPMSPKVKIKWNGTLLFQLDLSGSGTFSNIVNAAILQINGTPLGNAATFNIGTAANTIAAGNDSRITGAQPTATLGSALITALGATTPRSLAARAGDKVSVKDFGAVGDGVVDDTAAIVAALATGRTVYFPTGTYNYSSPLTVAAGMEGEDARLVTLNNTAPAGVGIVLSGSRPRVSGITLNASAVRAANSGYVIYVSPTTYGASIERVTVSGHWADHGIALDGAALTHIRQIDFLTPASGSNTTTGSAIVLTDNPIDTYIDGVNVDTWNVGMRLTHAGGVYVSRVDFVKCQHGFVFDPSASSNQGVFGAFFTQALADTSTSDGWLFTSDGGIADIAIGMSWPSSSVGTGSGGSVTGSGMRVDNPHVNGLTLTGVHCLNNWKHGLELLQGNNIGIVNCQVTENSIAGPATYDGIYIAPAVSQVRIVGNFIGQGGSIDSPSPAPNTPNFHRYGVNAVNTAPGDTRNITLVGNQLPSNVTAALNMPTGPGIVQTGNTDGTGVLAGTYATTNNPSFTGNVEITGDGSAPNAFFRMSASNFQIANSSYSAILLNLTQTADLATPGSVASTALYVQAGLVNRWGLSGGDTLSLVAYNASASALGTVLTINNASQAVTFNQAVSAPTAVAGTNTTQVATTAFVIGQTAFQAAGGATTTNVPAGQARVVKDTTGGSVRLVYNDAGTLRSVALT